ncbi:tetratricopeptide repeat protein [Thiohalobacter sp. IOR34]|uniref:YfgM family protein n=1 Tax=Thiohalobacter sp. IOR34 TaxID=3057176 RepID=UPI0025AFE0F7|nr:tetratricopeptide repeat protein [Thiohalobacter sp. IOR34]WJW76267.1 tetratricopeptide repeat protein [Thiohalobacter sp. IOR34]
MDVYKTEEEQGENLKKWLRENGASLATGILFGLAVLFGGKAWMEYQQRQAEQASNLYAQLTAAVARNDEAAATSQYEAMIKDFSASPYAVLSALQIARLQLGQENAEAARAQLQWAYEHAEQPGFRQVARLRLVRVLLGLDQLDAAQALLDAAEAGAFAASVAELRGDLAMARGDHAAAHAAYEQALAALEPDAPGRALLEAKRDDAVRVDTEGAAS